MRAFDVVPRRLVAAVAVMAAALTLQPIARADEPTAAAQENAVEQSHPFEATRVWQVHIELSADEYAAMQPLGGGGGGFFGFGRPPRAEPAEPADGRELELHRNQFGVDLPWARGSITIDDQTFTNVGIRYKGNGTIMDAEGSLKKSLKIELDHFGEDGKFAGLKTLNLHCGVTDPTKCRETMAYGLYRAAGVPAPRTALAEVRLTVEGRFDDRLLGVYTIVENVGGAFLRANFETDEGLLMKPENVRELDYVGPYWPSYEHNFKPKRKATDAESERVIAFANLIHEADDATFEREIASFVDVDAYLRFLAVTAYLSNSDSFFGLGHNYYLYLQPSMQQFHFVPWDLDRAFANFFMFGSPEQQMDLSLRHPYGGKHRLTERLLDMPAVSARYDELLKTLAEDCFAKPRLLAELDVIEGAIREARDRDTAVAEENRDDVPQRPHWGGDDSIPDLRTFIDRRGESVAKQLADATTGYVPRGGFGPPPGGPRGGPPPERPR